MRRVYSGLPTQLLLAQPSDARLQYLCHGPIVPVYNGAFRRRSNAKSFLQISYTHILRAHGTARSASPDFFNGRSSRAFPIGA